MSQKHFKPFTNSFFNTYLFSLPIFVHKKSHIMPINARHFFKAESHNLENILL